MQLKKPAQIPTHSLLIGLHSNPFDSPKNLQLNLMKVIISYRHRHKSFPIKIHEKLIN